MLYESEKICSSILSMGYKLIKSVTVCFKRTRLKNIKKEQTKKTAL